MIKLTEQHIVPHQFDLLSNTWKICGTKFMKMSSIFNTISELFFLNCFRFENQTLLQWKCSQKERNSLSTACKAKKPLLKISNEHLGSSFENYRLENKLFQELRWEMDILMLNIDHSKVILLSN